MNSVPVRVLEYHKRGDFDWSRKPECEVDIMPEWAKDPQPTPRAAPVANRAGNGTAAPNTGMFDDNAEGATNA